MSSGPEKSDVLPNRCTLQPSFVSFQGCILDLPAEPPGWQDPQSRVTKNEVHIAADDEFPDVLLRGSAGADRPLGICSGPCRAGSRGWWSWLQSPRQRRPV